MSWGGSGPLGGGPFGGGGATSAGPDPFGGATEFGFSIPQGDPGEIERAARACLARSFALSMQSQNIATATRAAVAGWEGGAQAAFAGYAGHVAKVIGANADAFGDAGTAMTALSRDLEHAQRVTRQAAKECASYQNDLTTAQGQATENSSHAQTLRTQAAAAVHPQTVGDLNHQAGIAQAAADAAAKAADKASGQLQIWQGKGRDADTTYAHQAQQSAHKIQAAAGRIQTVSSLPGGAPVPVTVTPGDVALATSMLGVAGGLPSAAEAMGDPEQLNRLAGGRPITPGTMLSYMNQALAEARKQQAAGKGSLVDAAGGLVHTLTFGAVTFGNSSRLAIRGPHAHGALEGQRQADLGRELVSASLRDVSRAADPRDVCHRRREPDPDEGVPERRAQPPGAARLDVPSRHEILVAPNSMITPTQFIDVVDRVLSPGLSTKGFAMVATDDFTIEFRGAAALLVVRYEERSHELSLWLSNYEDDSGEPPLELPDALRATDCPAADVDAVSLIQTHEVEPLQRLLGRVAEVIAKCAASFLEGDRASFDAARRIRAERARAYTAQVVNAPAIAEADSAWQARDYALVCEVLRPIRGELDDTHRRRLAFAESRL